MLISNKWPRRGKPMNDYRIIEVKESILADNDRDAEELRR